MVSQARSLVDGEHVLIDDLVEHGRIAVLELDERMAGELLVGGEVSQRQVEDVRKAAVNVLTFGSHQEDCVEHSPCLHTRQTRLAELGAHTLHKSVVHIVANAVVDDATLRAKAKRCGLMENL